VSVVFIFLRLKGAVVGSWWVVVGKVKGWSADWGQVQIGTWSRTACLSDRRSEGATGGQVIGSGDDKTNEVNL